MAIKTWISLQDKISDLLLSVPVRTKIAGIMVLPVLILGFALNYWVRTGLSDWLSYLLSDERVDIAMQAGSRSVFLVTALSAVASILLTALLMLTLTKPLLELRQVAQRVADGNLASRAKIWAQDEIGEVASSVNAMIDRLVTSQRKLERINRRLEAINRVALAAGKELDLQEVLDASLQATLDVMGLNSGWVYLRNSSDPGEAHFKLASGVAIPAELEHELIDNPAGICPCTRRLLADIFSNSAVLHPCQRLNEGKPAGSPDIYHITIPLEARGQRFGMINAICAEDQKPSDNDLDTLTTIGAQVSEFVANAWLHASLKEKEAARQALLSALVSAQEDERARLARELHDGAGQSLTSLLVRLKTLEKSAPSNELRDNVTNLCQAASETIEQIRGISHRLRPATLEEFGLEVALRTLVEEMLDKAEISAECRLKLDGRRLPFEIETNLYRIAQEGLTNVVRHANASRVLIELLALPYAVCLRIEDNGRGFTTDDIVEEQEPRRLGLVSIQERAEMLGGSLSVQSGPDAGTSVQVRIPFQWQEAA
jgi:signal transduction histidine kinase